MRSFIFFLAVLILAASTAGYAWKTGDRILGQWRGDFWYPGKITGQTGNEYDIQFDDKDSGSLPAERIKKINWKVGSRIYCNEKNRGIYYGCIIKKMKGDTIHVRYDDGEREVLKIGLCRSE
jgi:hypothetical protein